MRNLKISSRIIAIFIVAILCSFIADYLHSFFGDWYCQGAKTGALIPETKRFGEHYEIIGCDYRGDISHSPTWHWGYRHWVWLSMGISLFIFQVAELISFIQKQK